MSRKNTIALLPAPAKTFLAWLEFQKGMSEATAEAYARDLLDFEEFLTEYGASLAAPADIDKQLVQSFTAHLYRKGIAASSRARKLSALRSLFRYLQRTHKVEADPIAGVRNPKQEQRHPAMLNVDQMFSLLAEADAGTALSACTAEEVMALRDKALLELLYGSGLRISEALGLDVDDIRPGSNTLIVMGKDRNSGRYCSVTPAKPLSAAGWRFVLKCPPSPTNAHSSLENAAKGWTEA